MFFYGKNKTSPTINLQHNGYFSSSKYHILLLLNYPLPPACNVKYGSNLQTRLWVWFYKSSHLAGREGKELERKRQRIICLSIHKCLSSFHLHKTFFCLLVICNIQWEKKTKYCYIVCMFWISRRIWMESIDTSTVLFPIYIARPFSSSCHPS